MITIHYMRELNIEPENKWKPKRRSQSGDNADDGQLVRCRTGRFFRKYGLLRKQEKMIANQMQELQLVIYELPGQYAPGKKRRLIEAVRRVVGELWIEEKLMQEILIQEIPMQEISSQEISMQEKRFFGEPFWRSGLFKNRELLGEDFFRQPAVPLELARLRLYEETAAWKKRCRQNGGELDSFVVWNLDNSHGNETQNAVGVEWTDEGFSGTDTKEAFAELLFLLAESVNYFTIIGGNTEAFRELADRLFAEYGLPAQFLEKPVKGYRYGASPFVLQMGGRRKMRQDIFGTDAKCLDPYAGMPKFLDTIARNGYNTYS